MNIFGWKIKNDKNSKSILPFRLNLLFFIVFILFSILIAQLAYLQIVYGGKFKSEVSRTDKSVVSSSVPRGIIYDSKGRIIVDNGVQNAITFTKNSDLNNLKIYQTTNKLSKLIKVNTSELTNRQQIDYYLANTAKYNKLYSELPRNKKYNGKEQLPNDVVYTNLVNFVKKNGYKLNDSQKNAAEIYSKINSAYQLSTAYIKSSDVTSKEIAEVGEHLSELPGVGLGTDWKRKYPEGTSIKGIVGNVSSEKQGLPEDQVNELLAEGYSRNDRVGTSYLEKSYEPVLAGSKRETQMGINPKNKSETSKVLYKGHSGDDLTLTIDSKFQNEVEKILDKTYSAAQGAGRTGYSDGAYAVAMNPKTGEILAMAGISRNTVTGEKSSDALGVINRTFVMGSAVKPATILGGMMDGVITPSNNYLTEDPVYLPSTPVKKSDYPIGTFKGLSAPSALEVSSNEYMMKLAMLEGHAKYIPHKYIKIDNDIFTKMRSYYNQFGLGMKTGIDLPGEATGIEGSMFNEFGQLKVGSALDMSYGNYDAYTPIQMVQYMSSIANGGYRMQPHVVKSISSKDNGKDKLEYTSTPTVLNKIGSKPDELAVVKQGLYQVTHGTSGWATGTSLGELKQSVSGKTGTAQSFFYDPKNPGNSNPPETITTSFLGYAPTNNPEIAIDVVFPNMSTQDGKYNVSAAKAIFEEYFKENEENN